MRHLSDVSGLPRSSCCAAPARFTRSAGKFVTWATRSLMSTLVLTPTCCGEVDGFRAQGFWHDAGLGNVLFGSRHPDAGFAPFGRRFADGSYAYPSPVPCQFA